FIQYQTQPRWNCFATLALSFVQFAGSSRRVELAWLYPATPRLLGPGPISCRVRAGGRPGAKSNFYHPSSCGLGPADRIGHFLGSPGQAEAVQTLALAGL